MILFIALLCNHKTYSKRINNISLLAPRSNLNIIFLLLKPATGGPQVSVFLVSIPSLDKWGGFVRKGIQDQIFAKSKTPKKSS